MKRFLTESPSTSSSKKSKTSDDKFLKEIQNNRESTAASVKEFKINKKRVKILNNNEEVPEDKKAIVYWMARDQRGILINVNMRILFYYFLSLFFSSG